MKTRIFALCLCLLLLVAAAGCGTDVAVTHGSYLLDGDMEGPYMDIQEDGTFVAGQSMMASYALFGEYTIRGDKLLLTAEQKTCTFIIQDGITLALDKDETGFFTAPVGTLYTLWDP